MHVSIPEMVRAWCDGEYAKVASSLANQDSPEAAIEQSLWLAASLIQWQKATPQQIRQFSADFLKHLDDSRRKCHRCRTGEGASCDCV